MLKITEGERARHSVTLRLEGRLVGPWVEVLQNSCEAILTAGQTVTLHLADVDFLDPRGVALLAGLQCRGVSFLACPPFVAEQLKSTHGAQR